MLDIVLRTCDHTEVHPERGPRFIDCNKPTLIKKCLLSLLRSIDNARHLDHIKLHVVDDHSSEETVAFIKQTIASFNIPFEFYPCIDTGFNYSAVRQFEVCKLVGREWVYSVEDDYLHFPNAIERLIKASKNLSGVVGIPVAIRPDDDVFLYSRNSKHSREPSIVLLGEDRHWRTVKSAHNTIFMHKDVLKEYWELFASLGKFFKKLPVNEDNTINFIWDTVPLFSPIPSLAIHVSQNNEPPFLDYKSLWNSLD